MSTKDDAVKALETAVEKVDAFVSDPEENDARELNAHMRSLHQLLPNANQPTAGESVDALTGRPQAQNFDGPGPDSPLMARPETAQDTDNAPVADSENQSSGPYSDEPRAQN